MLRSITPMPANRRKASGAIAAPPVNAKRARLSPSCSRKGPSTSASASGSSARAAAGTALPSSAGTRAACPMASPQSTSARRQRGASSMRVCTRAARLSHCRGPRNTISQASSRIAAWIWSGRSAKLTHSGRIRPMVTPIHCSVAHDSGMYDRYSAPSGRSSARHSCSALCISAPWLVITPLGLPVVPEV